METLRYPYDFYLCLGKVLCPFIPDFIFNSRFHPISELNGEDEFEIRDEEE